MQERVSRSGMLAGKFVALAWLGVCLVGTWVFGAYPYGEGELPGIYLLSMVSAVVAIVPALTVVDVVHSATLRGRLGGTSFKVLNLGLALNAALLLVAELLNEAWPFGLRLLFALTTGAAAAVNLRTHGLPSAKLEVTGLLSASYCALSVMAACCAAALAATAHYIGKMMPMGSLDVAIGSHTIFTFGAFTSLLVFVFHTLQSAAVAGDKRLASATYRKMNLACVVASALMAAGTAVSASMGFAGAVLSRTCILVSVCTAATCGTGLYRGYKFDKEP